MKKRIVWCIAKQVIVVASVAAVLIAIRSGPKVILNGGAISKMGSYSETDSPQITNSAGIRRYDGEKMDSIPPSERRMAAQQSDVAGDLTRTDIEIWTEPAGARITIDMYGDRIYSGISPLRITVATEIMTVDASLAGHKTASVGIELAGIEVPKRIVMRLERDVEAITRAMESAETERLSPWVVSYSAKDKELELVADNNRSAFSNVITTPEKSGMSCAFIRQCQLGRQTVCVPSFVCFASNKFVLTVVCEPAESPILFPLDRFGLAKLDDIVFAYDLALSREIWQQTITGNFVPHLSGDFLVLRFVDSISLYDIFSGQLICSEKQGETVVTPISATD